VAHQTDPISQGQPQALDTAELEARGPRGLTPTERAALRRRLSPRWAFFSFAVLGLLALTLWLRYTAPTPAPAAAAPEPRPNSIVVLPFVNASPDSANEYFSDGMTDELTAALGRVPGLRVASPASAFALKRPGEDPRDAGRRLNVGTVLEGSVRQANDRLRVTVHLVSVSEGFDLWSETYERLPGDVFAVQEEIVRSVVGTLRIPGAERWTDSVRTTSNLEAYTAYLRARHAVARPADADPAYAAALYQEAIALDSGFAPAWAGLASAHAQRAMIQGARPSEAMPAARAAATRALALDSSLAVAHMALAQVRFHYDRAWLAADSAYRRALVINPNRAEVHHGYAHLLLAIGGADEALAHARRALELSPLDPEAIAHLGWHHLHTRKYSEVRESLDRSLTVDSTRADTRRLLGLLAEVLGDYELAESQYRAALGLAPYDPENLAALGRTHALDGRADEAGAMLARLDSLSAQRYVSPYLLAGIAEALGDSRRAFAWLEEAVADRVGEVVYLDLDPRLDRLRGDRRFERIRRSVGLP
jgi:TolB-like protein/tetratricopeptide (TPR) repeat protein